jgi:hypothetical protein
MKPTTVDDSKYNRLGPDPDALKRAGVYRIALSATPDGFGLMNVYFPEAVDRYLSAGIEVEAFHTWYKDLEPKDQVEAFRLALQYARWFALPGPARQVWVDIEKGGLPILNGGSATDSAWQTATGIAALGAPTGIYTSKEMWNNKVRIVPGRYPWARLFDLWAAHWNQWIKAPLVPYPWVKAVRWQYAGDVIFAGQDGIDLNIDLI